MNRLFIAIGIGLLTTNAIADATTGGVNWLDTLGYQKPAFVSITVPTEASATKYWVDMTSGSGTTCSEASPCAALSTVAGKSGTDGGPLYVYVKGTGNLGTSLWHPSSTFRGGAGTEIVIKPWPVGSTNCPSGCTATFQASGVVAIGASANVHHLIFDGGPDMGLIFKPPDDNAQPAVRFNATDSTLYRVQGTCGNNAGGGIFVSNEGDADNLRIINSEFYDCLNGGDLQQSAMYAGSCGGANCAGYNNWTIQGNIFRNFGGEAIELNPRTDSIDALIEGNVFHDIGYQTCNGSWNCRPAITIDASEATGSNAGTVTIQKNLMWDISASCVWTKDGVTHFYHNSCYDFGKQLNGDGTGGNVSSVEGLGAGASGNGINVTSKNNIIYSVVGKDPFDNANFLTNASNNVCGSGKSCGTNSQVWKD